MFLMIPTFGEWLQSEMDTREWTQADIARHSGITTAQISRLVSGARGAGKQTCTAIAHALGYPPETVYRAAGLLPDVPQDDAWLERVRALASQLDEDDKALALNLIYQLLGRKRNDARQDKQR